MVTKKRDLKKPSETSSIRAPKKKAAQSKKGTSHRHCIKDETIEPIAEVIK